MSLQHTEKSIEEWGRLTTLLEEGASTVVIDGRSLTATEVVAVSHYGVCTRIEETKYKRLHESLKSLRERLADGDIIYGVNTGFGGTADVRNSKAMELQRTLIRELHYGIMDISTRDPRPCNQISTRLRPQLEKKTVDTLPKSWTRAAILVRLNSLIKGVSSVRPIVVDRLLDLLRLDIIPIVPLHGSISASGDLSPLSYIGGAIQGKPTIRIHGVEEEFADQAFARAGLLPVTLEAKEGLAIVNGTAISAGVAALVMYDTHFLAILAQMLTAMSCEALLGTVESFDPFFSDMRPHPGQVEAARNIRVFLRGSKLVQVNDGTDSILRQDRYSIRTVPQWLGPVLEDIMLADQQITIEINSATDNPLESGGRILHGGNFQAMSVTSAMEKVRRGNCSIGRMLFTQCTEMINPSTSRGLPPNLVVEDPSQSFIFKGTDINMASLLSELGFLSNPVNHVQSAEMGNQSLNSLALISARYTDKANEILFQMAAAHLIAVCQALDIRALTIQFKDAVNSAVATILSTELVALHELETQNENLTSSVMKAFEKAFEATVSLDAPKRFKMIANSMANAVRIHPIANSLSKPQDTVLGVEHSLATAMTEAWCTHRSAYMSHGDASAYLAAGTGMLYRFVREEIGVPFLHSEKIRTPNVTEEGFKDKALTIGSYTSLVFEALRNGAARDKLGRCLMEFIS